MKKYKYINFEITMPNVGSWNGKWSGEKDYYAEVRIVDNPISDKILENDSFYYDFGDGWELVLNVMK